MALKETITQQMTAAIKSGDKVRLETIRSVRAGILEYEKSGKGEIADVNVLQIISNQVKKRKETIEIAQKANRMEIVEEEEAQLKILQEFLPKQMSAEEVRTEVLRIAEQAGSKEFSNVMPMVMKELKGKADGKMVQEIVKEVIQP
ncbi:MAG: GatB/YqeY domain-containing protein [Ignavibacteria bacterium]|nr:GatB/YqeY domain-containing protein [Ignavibacteria bacterium]